MKTFATFLLAFVLAGAGYACSNRYNAGNFDDDDIYYDPSDDRVEDAIDMPITDEPLPVEEASTAANQAAEAAGSAAGQGAGAAADDYFGERNSNRDNRNNIGNYDRANTDGGDTYVTNNYYGDGFNADDYYDYSYSARIRRFHRPVATYSYYDPFYTNSYFYNYDPYYYGTSVYTSYSWWRPRTYRRSTLSMCWGGNGWSFNYNYTPYCSGYYASTAYTYYPYWTYGGYGWANNQNVWCEQQYSTAWGGYGGYGYGGWNNCNGCYGYQPFGYNNFYSSFSWNSDIFEFDPKDVDLLLEDIVLGGDSIEHQPRLEDFLEHLLSIGA